MSLDNETRTAWDAYEKQNERINPRTAPAHPVTPRPVPRPVAQQEPAPAPSRHDQLLSRAKAVPSLAKLVERHDTLMAQIAEKLDAAEKADQERRQREVELTQLREAAEKHEAELVKVQNRLRELQPGKSGKRKQFNLSDAERERRRQQAYAMQAKLREKREAAKRV